MFYLSRACSRLAEPFDNLLEKVGLYEELNTLANLQETFSPVPGNIEYRAEMIPVSKFSLESGDVYCVEMEDFARLKRSQKIDEASALNQILEALKDEEDNDIEDIDEIAIVLEKEDTEALEKKVKELVLI